MLAGEDNHRLRKHLQAYGTNQLFLQVVHVIHFSNNFPGRKKKDKTKQNKTPPRQHVKKWLKTANGGILGEGLLLRSWWVQ